MTADVGGLIDVVNVPGIVAALCHAKMATLNELQTVYGVEDAYDMLEIVAVNSHNERRASEHYARKP